MRHGIYFDLPEDDYHADPALGSTDLKNLLVSPSDYWWASPLNPNQPDKTTPSQEFGTALHKRVLEGSQAFAGKYIRRPDDVKVLTAKIKAALCPNGEHVLDGDQFERIEIAASEIAANPALATAFEGGMSEVSVFWLRQWAGGATIRCKARIDYLKVRGVGDLKSISNKYRRPFGEACTRAIHEYRYDVQAAHYLEGRAAMRELVEQELVYGDFDPAWLGRVVAARNFAFQWVFFQAEPAAPITWSRSLSPGNPVLAIGQRDREKALSLWFTYRLLYPDDDDMWRSEEPVTELDINEMPGWYR